MSSKLRVSAIALLRQSGGARPLGTWARAAILCRRARTPWALGQPAANHILPNTSLRVEGGIEVMPVIAYRVVRLSEPALEAIAGRRSQDAAYTSGVPLPARTAPRRLSDSLRAPSAAAATASLLLATDPRSSLTRLCAGTVAMPDLTRSADASLLGCANGHECTRPPPLSRAPYTTT